MEAPGTGPNRIGLPIWLDRAVLAAYCQACGSWAKAQRKQSDRPTILKISAGYVHAPPRLTICNKQLELKATPMVDLRLTPASRARLAAQVPSGPKP